MGWPSNNSKSLSTERDKCADLQTSVFMTRKKRKIHRTIKVNYPVLNTQEHAVTLVRKAN